MERTEEYENKEKRTRVEKGKETGKRKEGKMFWRKGKT